MALMDPYQQALSVDTSLAFNPPMQLDTNTFTAASPSGEASQPTATNAQQPSANYTPPSTTLTPQQQAQQQASLTAQAIQNNQQAASSPYGISPSNAGSIAGKVFNTLDGKTGAGTFSNQVNALDQFGANNLGTGLAANPSLQYLGANVSDAALSSGGLSSGGIDAYTAASTGLGETVSPAVAAGDLAATPGAASGIAGSVTDASLSSILGSAGIGALGGGLLANLTGGNQLGGSIGGAIGAAAMSATGLGAAIGTLIPIPGVGTILGAAAGGLIGGLFGGGQQASYQALGVTDISNWNGTLSYGSKNSSESFVQQLGPQLQSAITTASQQLGTQLQGSISAGYNTQSKGGYFVQYQTPDGKTNTLENFDPNDPASQQAALAKILQAAGTASGVDSTKLSNYISSLSGGTNSGGTSSGSGIPGAGPPAIPVSQSFASYVASKQGTSNGTNGSATPAVPTS